MTAEEFKSTYDEIRSLGSQVNGLFVAANGYIKEGIKVLAKDFDYSFVVEQALRERLQESCERMLVARTGFLHIDGDSAFEDLARNIHLQIEGLSNCWFNQFYLKENSILNFPLEYTELRIKQQLMYSHKTDAFFNELATLGFLPNEFYEDFVHLKGNEGELLKKYDLAFRISGFGISQLGSVYVPPDADRSESITFKIKAEYIFLVETGLKSFFTFHPISRLNQYRNALISHMGIVSGKAEYLEALVNKPDRVNILIRAFDSYYQIVKSRVVV